MHLSENDHHDLSSTPSNSLETFKQNLAHGHALDQGIVCVCVCV